MAALRQRATLPRTMAGSDTTLLAWAATYRRVHLDLGAGDGALALHIARQHPDTAVIGLDINLDRVRGAPKRRPGNLRFVAGDAITIPTDALPAADAITIAFPYGSLLRGLVNGDDRLIGRLDTWLRPGSRIDVRVNASALLAAGFHPKCAEAAIASTLRHIAGLDCRTEPLGPAELRRLPSTWSRRLGYGRPAGAWLLAGTRRHLLPAATCPATHVSSARPADEGAERHARW